MANDKQDTNGNGQNINGGIVSTLQRMVGKLGDIIQKSSSKSTAIEMAIDPIQLWSTTGGSTLNLDSSNSWDDYSEEDEIDECSELANMIEVSLRDAKDGPLGCGEVLLPAELTSRVARDVVRLSENEPCGLRGCALLLAYEEQQECKKIGLVQYDPSMVATFEVILTLKKDLNTWTNLRHFLPFKACLKKFGKKSTVLVSPVYNLSKRKLYRSGSQ